jgi:hypothetical protein
VLFISAFISVRERLVTLFVRLFVCLVARRVTGVDDHIEIDSSLDETRLTSAQTGRRKRVSSGERLARDCG